MKVDLTTLQLAMIVFITIPIIMLKFLTLADDKYIMEATQPYLSPTKASISCVLETSPAKSQLTERNNNTINILKISLQNNVQ